MPKTRIVGTTQYNFPDNYSDEQIAEALMHQGVIKRPASPTGPSWSDRMFSGIDPRRVEAAKALVDFGEGAVSGLATTANNVAQFADLASGGPLFRKLTGFQDPTDTPEAQALIKRATTAPDTTAGRVGRGAEQIAELAIPSMAAAKALKAAQYGRAAIVGADAAIQGGITGFQTGGDPTEMAKAALISGAVGTAGAGLGALLEKGKGAAAALREAALKQYQQVLNPTKEGTKFLAKTSTAPGLLDRGVRAWTLKGLLGKAQNEAEAVGQLIGDAWDNLPQGTKVELLPITDKLAQDAAEAFTVKVASGGTKPMTDMGANALSTVDRMKTLLVEMAEVNPKTGKLEVPVDALRKLRQSWDAVAAQAKRYQGKDLADHAVGEIHGMGADSIRNKLAADFPNIAELNKEYKFWRDAAQVIEETVTRRVGQAKSMSRQIASVGGAVAGATMGGPHAAMAGKVAMDHLTEATSSAAWKTTSAVLKNKLANAIAKGNRGEIEFYIGKLFKATVVDASTK